MSRKWTSKTTLKLVYSAVCLALCLVLPSFFTGENFQLGQLLSPMHLPVLLCGFLCGWPWGLAVGLIAPILRSLIFSMPPLFPTAVAMTFELAVYGLLTGLLYKILPKKIPYIYVTIISAMLGGRIVGGIANFLFAGLGLTKPYTFGAFISAYFVGTWPGIVLQIIIVPLLVIALRKAKLVLNE